jgi:hypothetical protein
MSRLPSASPLAVPCGALSTAQLQDVGRYVAANDFDATTRTIRELAAAGPAFGFAPYWRASVATDRTAHRADCRLVAFADTPPAPVASQ